MRLKKLTGEGCRHGYEKAMNEMRGGMGFRESGNYSGGNGYGNEGYGERYDMGERRMPGYFRGIPEWMRWENVGADVPMVSFIDTGGVEFPLFTKS